MLSLRTFPSSISYVSSYVLYSNPSVRLYLISLASSPHLSSGPHSYRFSFERILPFVFSDVRIGLLSTLPMYIILSFAISFASSSTRLLPFRSNWRFYTYDVEVDICPYTASRTPTWMILFALPFYVRVCRARPTHDLSVPVISWVLCSKFYE